MKTKIYRNIIEDSDFAYLHIKIFRDEDNIYNNLKIIDVNKSYERYFGFGKDVLIEKVFENYKSKEERLYWHRVFTDAIENEKYELHKYIRADEYIFNVGIYSAGNDEFHLVYTKLGEQYTKLNPILKNSPFCAWIKDIYGYYVDVNDVFLQAVKKSYSEVVGKNDFDLWQEDIAINYIYNDAKAIEKNDIHIYEEISTMDKVNLRYYEIAKWPYTNEISEAVIGTMGIGIDITDKVEVRNSIERNEKIFLEIANNLEEVIIIRDKEKATYISPSFEKIFGFRPDDLYDDINKWNDYWDEVEYLEKTEECCFEKTCSSTFKVIKKGELEKWLVSKFVPIKDEKGNVIKKIGTITDITIKKEFELELDNLSMDFFANLSHELRTPINLILSALKVVSLRVDKLGDEDRCYINKYLKIVSQNGLRLLKLVNNLIDTTKLDSGNFTCNKENHDIVSFIENICSSVSEYVKERNLNIIFDTNIEEKFIAFDLDNMERIILNLLSNAIKFSKTDTNIVITVMHDDDIKISVKDEGIGIPEDKLDNIFGRFEQVKSKMKKEEEGSGIGLSLVKSLVEKNNGTINVKSVLGEGSEFTITLLDEIIDDNIKNDNQLYYTKNNVNRMIVEFSDIYC